MADRPWPGQWPLRTQLELAALNTAPGRARTHVRAVLRDWHSDEDTIDTVALVMTELLTNAIETTRVHCRRSPHSSVRLWMLGDGVSVLVLIWDATVPAPALLTRVPGGEHGRGLALVNDLCEKWDYYRPAEEPYGKVVWALVRAL